MPKLPDQLAVCAAGLLGGRLLRQRRLAGGDLSAVVAITLDDGREAVVKCGPDPAIEAAMLEAIRASGAPTPAVLAVDAALLVLERLSADGALDATALRDLGAVLARLHAATGPRYGWPHDHAFADVAIENAWADDWPSFWAERRLSNQLPHLPRELATRVGRLADALPQRLPARPPASLLHGDLWTGNLLVDRGRISGLIDPACYYGDAEVDVAMLGLFGPIDAAFFETYGRLADGYRERRPIYQLWPALVHLRLFGAGYRPLVERLLGAAGV